jgi:hypothetical protein
MQLNRSLPGLLDKDFKKVIRMERIVLFLLVGSLIFITPGCLKDNDCNPKTVQSEQAEITAYAASNAINGAFHSSGLYFKVTTPGSGPTPTTGSVVSVRYTGKLLNGTVFDSHQGTPVQIERRYYKTGHSFLTGLWMPGFRANTR